MDRESFVDKDFPRDFSLTVSRSEYDPEEKIISVRLEMNIEPESGAVDRPYEMRIKIAGHFEVDEEKFPIEHINNFAENNAPVILIPYIREQAYSLSIRAGVDPVIFPLVQVPVFRIVKQEQA
ncbi:preprotein translocase subunit SecB [Pseudomonas prosekii]|uniref:Preprotein translocase subunit SecB n=1 Tax=Pseudomonas prosekii TaxID=1148509 RepID=A0A1H1V3H0_9PSED|nr:preprotein translocase subunit SecB [Pseudomonas prosekii]